MLESLNDCYCNRAALMSSQMPVDKWYAQWRNEIDGGGGFRLTMPTTYVDALLLPGRAAGSVGIRAAGTVVDYVAK
ncbi:hypothetical protein ACK2SD_01440 [Pseudomonas sp. SC11]|uniref:hypothetical protein n=1 Tax=Pseudomonas sp. SC11 TaxID=326927 RepID=UPI00399B846F